MRLLLVRHGETAWSRDGRYQGRSDPPLSAPGEAQARALAQRLAGTEVHRLVAGPLQRAQATAQCIGAELGLPVATDPRLTELAYGAWEGLRQAEVKQRWPELLRLWKRHPERVSLPEGETLEDLRRRVQSYLDEAAAGPATTVAVTHAGVIRTMVLLASGAALSAFRAVQIETASLSTLRWQHGGWRVQAIGDRAHWQSRSQIRPQLQPQPPLAAPTPAQP